MQDKRELISAIDELEILTKSRRRCCLCAYLDGDWRQKKGQIAHIDHDRANSKRGNLAFLCLDHHDEQGRRGDSQAKKYTDAEVKLLRDTLYENVSRVVELGLQMADDVAIAPYAIVTDYSIVGNEAKATIRNFSGSPGLITEVKLYSGGAYYRWVGKCAIAGNESINGFPVGSREGAHLIDARSLRFEIEVTDLAEVVSRRREGKVGRAFV